MKAQFYSTVRQLAGETPNFPMLLSELPKQLRNLVSDAASYSSCERTVNDRALNLSRAGWVLDEYVGPGATHSLISLDGSITRYIDVESEFDLANNELDALFDSEPMGIRQLDESISDIVQVAGDCHRGVLSRARANMMLRDRGWRLVEIRHPRASHVLAPLRGNRACHSLVKVHNSGDSSSS